MLLDQLADANYCRFFLLLLDLNLLLLLLHGLLHLWVFFLNFLQDVFRLKEVHFYQLLVFVRDLLRDLSLPEVALHDLLRGLFDVFEILVVDLPLQSFLDFLERVDHRELDLVLVLALSVGFHLLHLLAAVVAAVLSALSRQPLVQHLEDVLAQDDPVNAAVLLLTEVDELIPRTELLRPLSLSFLLHQVFIVLQFQQRLALQLVPVIDALNPLFVNPECVLY